MPERTLHAHGHRLCLSLFLVLAVAMPAQLHAQTFTQIPTVDAARGETTHESMLAAGPTRILDISPRFVSLYDKSTPPILLTDPPIPLNTFFNTSVSGDPMAYYDPVHGRYLIVVMVGDDTGPLPDDELYLWISKSSDPTTQASDWWQYSFHASTDRDYPSIGVSDDKLVVLWDGSSPNARVLDRAKAYDHAYGANEPVAFDLVVPPLTRACRNITTDATIHLVRKDFNISSLSEEIKYSTVTGPANDFAHSSEVGFTIPPLPSVLDPTAPPKANMYQPDTSAFGGCEPRGVYENAKQSEIYMRDGRIAMAWAQANSYGDGSPPVNGIRCVRFQVTGAILDNFIIGRSGTHYYFPSVAEDARGTLFVGYDRMSPNEFPSCYMVARRGSHQSPEYLVKSGDFTFLGCENGLFNCNGVGRYGDYTSMIADEFAVGSNHTTARFVGGWTKDALFYGASNAIGGIVATFGTSTISGTVLSDAGGVRTALSGVPVILLSGTLPVDSTTSSSPGGTFQFSDLPAETYTLRIAWPQAVRLTAVPGSGATSQTIVSTTDISILIANGQTSAGNQLVVSAQPAPSISSLSTQTVRNTDSNFDLVVNGSNFRAWSVVLVDGRPKNTVFNQVSGSLTARVLHYDVARSGTHTISVMTPTAPAGAIPTQPLVSMPRYIESVAFTNFVSACPAGDAGHLTFTVVAKSDATCGFTPPNTALLQLTAVGQPAMQIWDAVPIPTQPYFTVTSLGTVLANGMRSYSFDVGKISTCGFLTARCSFDFGAHNIDLPVIDVRSLDLAAPIGLVDQSDVNAVTASLGTSDRCGDLNRSGSVTNADPDLIAPHIGHSNPVYVTSPYGGQAYGRTPISQQTVPIRWATVCGGVIPCGIERRVTIKIYQKINYGYVPTTIASNLPDNGAYDWNDHCDFFSNIPERIEVIVTTTAGSPLASDLSDGDFTFAGACGAGGGSCPYLDTQVAGGWMEENSILGRSTTGALLNDLHRLTHVPEIKAGGTIQLRIREDEQERTRLASVALGTVDRAPDQESWVVDGRVVLGSRVPVARVRTVAGKDITRLVVGTGAGFDAEPGTVLLVDLWNAEDDPPADVRRRGGVIITAGGKEPDGLLSGPLTNTDDAVLKATGIRVETPDGRGAWSQAARWYPRAKNAELSAVTGREVRLVFVGRHHVRNLQWMRVDDDDPVTGLTPAGTATHSVAGEVAGMLGGAGKEEVTLSPGERLTLTFRVPPMPEGKVRDYYFASRGVYTTLPSQGGTSAELPKQLELLPARPNPTGGTVRLGFALPTPGRVRLTIFDPMGRMVLRPIDGLKDAGRHELTWDLKDRSGRRVPSGIYFYRMEVGSWKQERRLTVR